MSALAQMVALTRAQPTDTLVASMIAIGDPVGNSPERVALIHICDELERRHDLTDALGELYAPDDPAECPATYPDAILIALANAGII